MGEKEERITARVPAALKDLMQRYVGERMYLNESDLIRDAVREKIQREAPELYTSFLRRKKGRGSA
jgi:Arc/MetJ-type ribon-helix-helix transcriptional regulator